MPDHAPSPHEAPTTVESGPDALSKKPAPVNPDQEVTSREQNAKTDQESPINEHFGVQIHTEWSPAEHRSLAADAFAQAEQVIEAEGDDRSVSTLDHLDSGYESENVASDTTSLTSSVFGFVFENGRRYHRYREGVYNFPNDPVEQEREDMKHAMVKLLCNDRLHFAPIGSYPQHVLDIGTGTGAWAIEMGDLYPSAEILGLDLSPIQAEWAPPNVRFLVDDVEAPWMSPENHFDYIHSRHTVMGIKDWPQLFRRAFDHLKPGGWMELQEVHHMPVTAKKGGQLPKDNPVVQYWQYIHDGLGALGVEFDAAADGRLTRMMEQAGFINVSQKVLNIPLGPWPKNKLLKAVGVFWRKVLLDGLQAIAMGPMTRGLGWTPQSVEMFLLTARQAYYDASPCMFMPFYIITGQKPGELS